jgi:FAD/FMN-containing dehydrogenase
MLFDCLQVSVRTPRTTLGGVECHNSSGAQHRAYCGTNDFVAGDRQER